jgi:hypothetical protein
MYIHYKNTIYMYDNNDFEKNILISKLRFHTNLILIQIESIVNLYLCMKRLKCRYDIKIETYVNTMIASIHS